MIDFLPSLSLIDGQQMVWLRRQGISARVLAALCPIEIACGHRGDDGRFEPGDGEPHIVFEEPEDLIFWQPKTDDLLTLNGRSFALNEQHIANASTYSFDANLNVFASVLDWMRADCDGVVVLDWARAFDQMRDAPRIAIAEPLLNSYRKWMRPQRLPILSVIPSSERIAA